MASVEVKELQDQLKNLRSTIAKIINEQNERLSKRIYELEDELEILEAKVNELEKEKYELEQEKNKAESERGTINIQLDNFRNTFSILKKEIEKIKDLVVELYELENETSVDKEGKEEKSDKRSLLLF